MCKEKHLTNKERKLLNYLRFLKTNAHNDMITDSQYREIAISVLEMVEFEDEDDGD